MLGTHLGGHDGQPHAVVGLVELDDVDLRLAAGDGHGPVAHHTRATRLRGTNTGMSTGRETKGSVCSFMYILF